MGVEWDGREERKCGLRFSVWLSLVWVADIDQFVSGAVRMILLA